LFINRYIYWRQGTVMLNGSSFLALKETTAEEQSLEAYRQSGVQYPKFFKMDLLSRTAFLCAEWLGPYPEEYKLHTATLISTLSGCISVDHKFDQSRKSLASPALFVYTLPNIMLGEICIRHGFKGEQQCSIEAALNPALLQFQVADLFAHRGTQACLCGHAEATDQGIEVQLAWVTPGAESLGAIPFSAQNLKQIFTTH
jgi:hypothetical protein